MAITVLARKFTGKTDSGVFKKPVKGRLFCAPRVEQSDSGSPSIRLPATLRRPAKISPPEAGHGGLARNILIEGPKPGAEVHRGLYVRLGPQILFVTNQVRQMTT